MLHCDENNNFYLTIISLIIVYLICLHTQCLKKCQRCLRPFRLLRDHSFAATSVFMIKHSDNRWFIMIPPPCETICLSLSGGCKVQVTGCRLELQVAVLPQLKQPKPLQKMLSLGLNIIFWALR